MQIFAFLATIRCLNEQWFIGVYTLMCQRFPRPLEGILVQSSSEHPSLCHSETLMIWSQPENVTFDSDDWGRLLNNWRAHTQMCVCAIATHLLPIEALPHQRGLVELWFIGRALLSGEGWFRTFQFISAGTFTHAGDSQGKFLVTLWCQGDLWGRVGGTNNHTL